MAIKAKLGYVSDAVNSVTKSPILGKEITINATGTVDDVECKFVLDGAAYYKSNYIEVKWPDTDFAYYYFINRRESLSGNRTLLTCELDVLYTFSSIILECPAVLARTSNSDYVNFFIRDTKVPIVSTTQISTKNFGNQILPNNAQEYIYAGIWQTSKAVGGEAP